MNNEIHERQNIDWSLDRLVAQRTLYRSAKSLENLRLSLIILVVFLLIVAFFLRVNEFIQSSTVIVVLLWFLDQAVLPTANRQEKGRSSYRSRGI